jgi:hypothetical protein
VAGNKGSADLVRDVRGFAVKLYTKEGNWDIVGNNIPVFFIQDAIKFPDLKKWLGSMALSKRDRPGAVRHFQRAEDELRAEGVSSNGVQANDPRTNLNANETSQDLNAVNMHSNRGANATY